MKTVDIKSVLEQIRNGAAKCYLAPSTEEINQAKLRLTIEKNLTSLDGAKLGNSFADVIKDKGTPVANATK